MPAPHVATQDKAPVTAAEKPATAAATAKEQPQDPLKQVQALVEKKIRNLEKRKGKLEVFRKGLTEGEALNEDQKKAVSKYEDVLLNLEFFRDFEKSVQKISEEATKERKRLEKEQIKKIRTERERARTLLLLQHVLSLLDDQSVRSVLLKGVTGIEPVTEDRLKKIDQFKDSIRIGTKVSEEGFSKQMDSIVDRLSNLAEGKKKDAVKGLSYADLKDLLLSIHNSGIATATPDNQTPPEPEKVVEAVVPVPTVSPISQAAQAQEAEGPAVYSFGTVDAHPDQDPAVVSIIPSFAAANGSIPSQIYTNPSYSGVFVPVTGAVVPGGHIIPGPQLIAAAPPHFQSQPQAAHPPAESTGQQFDQQQQQQQSSVEQTAFEVSNLNLNDGSQNQPVENEFRQKESRRNKYQSHGYRRDEKPNKNTDFHGASNGFQRKPDRYQGNNREGRGGGYVGDRKSQPHRGPGGRGTGVRSDRPAGAPRSATGGNNQAPKQWSG